MVLETAPAITAVMDHGGEWENELSDKDEAKLMKLRMALRKEWLNTAGMTVPIVVATNEYNELKAFIDEHSKQTGGKKPAAKKPAAKKPAAKKPAAKTPATKKPAAKKPAAKKPAAKKPAAKK